MRGALTSTAHVLRLTDYFLRSVLDWIKQTKKVLKNLQREVTRLKLLL